MLCTASIAAFAVLLAEGPSPVLLEEFVFEDAPFPRCHASTIAETPNGTLVAAWFGGTREKSPDVDIWISRKEPGGSWSKVERVGSGVQYVDAKGVIHRHPCWNPVLHQEPDGPLLLFFKVGPSPDAWWGMLTRSDDGGRTWSEACRLPEGILGPVKNKPLRLPDGVLLCGSSTEHDGWRVHFEITEDLGRSWTRIGPIHDGEEISAIQPSLLRLKNGDLLAIGRSRQGRLWQARSKDQGRSWAEPTLTDVPNPSAGTDAVTLADGRHLLVFNPTTRGRSPLAVAVSEDGSSWETALTLEDEPGREFSYPAVIQTSDGLVHMTYTWKRERIKHVAIDPSRL